MSDQEGAARIEDSGRVDQIMRIDTSALLNVIRDLEVKLSDHHRQVGRLKIKLYATEVPVILLIVSTFSSLFCLMFCSEGFVISYRVPDPH